MSIFSFFKKKSGTAKTTYNGITFEAPEPMSNEVYQEMRKREVEHLEAKYDLKTVHGINSIPVPRVRELSSGGLSNVTGRIEYYLMRKAGGYEKAGEVELALACYSKANALMPMSPIAYQRDSYMLLPRYLRKLRRFDEARIEEEKINTTFPENSNLSIADELRYRENKASELRWAAKEGTDLVEVSWISGCCEKCGKYRGRIFSFTGSDKRFPPFPTDFCEKCGLTYFTFIFEISSPMYSKKKGKALIKEMNKPFVDSRTEQDLKNYSLVLSREAEEIARKRNQDDYNWLWEYRPDICPKSFSAYMRMKNGQTETYNKIVIEAQKSGRVIK